MSRMYKLTHEHLLDVLDYDPATGIFLWKVARSNRVKIGSRAGVLHQASGGRYIAIDGEKLMAHRLAFYYVNKRWPNTDVRPLDGNYDNAAVENLQEISRVELAHQRSMASTNKSGRAGVSASRDGRWQSSITWNYRQISLGGNFESIEEAGRIHDEAELRLKEAQTEADVERIIAEVRLFKRQRAVWWNLTRQNIPLGWESFEAFAADVKDVPKMRYALAPLDITQPIGPNNYRWASASEHVTSTVEGKRAYARDNRRLNKDQLRDRDFRKKYKITYADYMKLFEKQHGVCASCQRPETKIQFGEVRMLSVDHDHETDKVRGLLCGNCNQGIGYFGNDRPDLLRAAARYLDAYYGRTGELLIARPSSQDHTVSAAMAASPHRDWLPVATLGFGA